MEQMALPRGGVRDTTEAVLREVWDRSPPSGPAFFFARGSGQRRAVLNRVPCGWRATSIPCVPTHCGWLAGTVAGGVAGARGAKRIVREPDLAIVETEASYLHPWLLPAHSSEYQVNGRPEGAGCRIRQCEHLIRLLGGPDELFYGGDRGGEWSSAALGTLQRHATGQQRAALPSVACIPVQGTQRPFPVPKVAADGYWVASAVETTW